MKSFALGMAAVVCAALAPAASAVVPANLLVNPSFEFQSTGQAGPGYALLGGGSMAIQGWTTVHSGVEWFNPAAFGYAAAPDGNLVVDLANYVYSQGGLEQTFATDPGVAYDLSFMLGTHAASGRDGTAEIRVTVAGSTHVYNLSNLSSQIVWTPISVSFTALGASTTLRFESLQNANVHFAYVDGVSASLAAVPEPGRMATMLTGVGLMAWVLRRRVRADPRARLR